MPQLAQSWQKVVEGWGKALSLLYPHHARLVADLVAVGAGLLGEQVALSDERSEALHKLGQAVRKRLLSAAEDQTLQEQQARRIAEVSKRSMRKPADLGRMSPEDFEYWVAGYFKRRRFRHVVVTQFSRDMGIDIYMKTPRGKEAIAQVKRYGKPVGRPVVQQTLGAMMQVGAECCYVVTNSTFSREAWEAAEKLPRLVHLIDGDQLLSGP